MISHSHQFIFIHIPRTGGTSISNSLSPFGIQHQGPRNFGSIYFKHATAMDLREMLGDEFSSYFRFTVVRNPWDWVVSNFYFNGGLHRPYVRGSKIPLSGKQPPWVSVMGFGPWLDWWLSVLEPTQMQMIADADGTLLVDEVLRFENLTEEHRRLAKILDLNLPPLPHLKSTPRPRAYRDFFVSQTRKLVEDHFHREIRQFGYTF